MASSSVGSDIFAFVGLLVICLTVLLLLRYYLPLRSTPAYLLIPVFLALALPSTIVLLVPIDLASASGSDEGTRGVWLPERLILVSWRICYWLTFILTWAILPLLGEYADSGYREPRDRFTYSLRQNGRYQLIVLGSAIAAAVYYFLTYGFNGTSLKGTVMALAYAWGLVLAIYLMGHGLVALPRRLFRDASISSRLRRLQAAAPKLHEKMGDAIEDLEQYESQVAELRKRKAGTAKDFADWIDELAESSFHAESRIPNTLLSAARSNPAPPNVITERYLADLARKLKRARHRRARFIDEWDALVYAALRTQTIIDSASSQRLDFGAPGPYAPFWERWTLISPRLRYYLHTHVVPASRYFFGSLLACMSVLVVWSELVKKVAPKLSAIGLTVVHHPGSQRGEVGLAGQLLAGGWLVYMIACALLSVTEVKVWGNRALVRRNTYEESACWYAMQVAKLTVPLSYNFVTFMPPGVARSTQFYHFLGRLVDLTPLGSGFDDYFPIFILIPVCATLFGLYGKAKKILGFGAVMDDAEEDSGDGGPAGYGAGGWREGRALIEREVAGRAADGSSLGLNARASGGVEAGPGTRNPGFSDRALPSATTSTAQSSRTVASDGAVRRDRDRGRVPLVDPEEDQGGFFQDFAHRVQNTFDTANTPAWLQGVGEGFKKPKWMGGGDEGTAGAGAGEDGGLGRWFGGRPSEGRVRL